PRRLRPRLEQVDRLGQSLARPLSARLTHWNSAFPAEILSAIVRPEHRAAVWSVQSWNDEVFAESEGETPLSRILDHNFRTYLPEDLLVKVDRASMAVSLETRSPMLDSGLIEFAGRLPDRYKIRGLTTKRILRDTFHDLFAPVLLTRPKRGFASPLVKWIS